VKVAQLSRIGTARTPVWLLQEGELLEAHLHPEGVTHDAPLSPGDVIRVCVPVTLLTEEPAAPAKSYTDEPLPFGAP
jgi:hypothetical protein